ncbi:D-galactarate dehydratase [Yoonia sp. I 8.24]|uniref:D-galactarate dehydratase n=1 Tax=Yoonia sp. I 8.24 TaxID=1537229 RepID=UPI001EE0E3F7|nr:D-galactarate dehydratase [Yoonia sp. I 8.24]MCG3266524.1 D-galactarate dehydratase [Yoonia sp. I 8.24]
MDIKLLLPIVALAGCTTPAFQEVSPPSGPVTETTVVAVAPPASAATVEEFDTTSAEDRAAATAPTESIDVALGVTIASLGPPTEPGIWLKTPLVDAVTLGRVGYDGESVNLELRPSGGEAGAGSQISLAAMRLLGVPLTSLPELTVYRQ